ERKLGAKTFRNKFKTITADNGTEFALHKEIERSCINAGFRTTIYFCHPYCSSERGTNENTNKLIRKYIPKGADIGKYTSTQIKEIENTINNYPRELFGGLSTNEYKTLCNINI
ncbi:MAG: IS30 family transposase, partial [Lachnospiraceae bacterium]|nr:IS30 family transposase [Lachnospiraceae bacterium]